MKLKDLMKEYLEEQMAREYSQRFLRRLMFLYFLQTKGWLRDVRGNTDYINRINDFRMIDMFFNEGVSKKTEMTTSFYYRTSIPQRFPI